VGFFDHPSPLAGGILAFRLCHHVSFETPHGALIESDQPAAWSIQIGD
jgi:hypothetical protein